MKSDCKETIRHVAGTWRADEGSTLILPIKRPYSSALNRFKAVQTFTASRTADLFLPPGGSVHSCRARSSNGVISSSRIDAPTLPRWLSPGHRRPHCLGVSIERNHGSRTNTCPLPLVVRTLGLKGDFTRLVSERFIHNSIRDFVNEHKPHLCGGVLAAKAF